MMRIDRRRLLKFTGAATVAVSTSGITGILASGRAPAYGQTTSLQWLKFVDFVPVSDQLLRGKITEQCQKALGIKLNIETIEGNGIQPRITSAIQSSTGPDIIMAINNWPQLYGESVASGKSADVIAVDSSPLDNVSVLERVAFVMARGHVYRK